jgi:hypothetical protein
MSATNGEALVSAINQLLIRLDVRGVSANEIVACIKPLIADSEARAQGRCRMSTPITQIYRSLIDQIRAGDRCVRFDITDEQAARLIADSEARACAELRAEITRLDAEKPWLKEANATNADLRAEVKRLTAQVALDDRAKGTMLKVFHNEQARAERAEASLHALRLVCGTTVADKFSTWVDRANARAQKAEAELAAERARLRDLWCEMALEYRDERISYVSVQITRSVWDELDAAMKEGAK